MKPSLRTPHRARPVRLVLSGLAATTLGLAACSDDEDSPTDDEPPSSGSVPATEPIDSVMAPDTATGSVPPPSATG